MDNIPGLTPALEDRRRINHRVNDDDIIIPSIVMQNQDNDIMITSESAGGQCGICLKTRAKYTCPRCNLPYCAQACYKDRLHQDCTEYFYRQQIQQELSSSEPPGPSMKIPGVKVRHDDDGYLEDLDGKDDREVMTESVEMRGYEGGGGGELDDKQFEALWEALSVEEQRDLVGTALRDKYFWRNPIIRRQLWQPWWTGGDREPLLLAFTQTQQQFTQQHFNQQQFNQQQFNQQQFTQLQQQQQQQTAATAESTPIKSDSSSSSDPSSSLPSASMDLSQFTQSLEDWPSFIPADGLSALLKSRERLWNIQPDQLICSIVHLLFCYAYTSRHFNGKHRLVDGMIMDVQDIIFKCSGDILRPPGKQFTSIHAVIDDFLHYSSIASEIQSLPTWSQLCCDVYDLLSGRGRFIQYALMDLRKTLSTTTISTTTKINTVTQFSKGELVEYSTKPVLMARKKIEFLLTFLRDFLAGRVIVKRKFGGDDDKICIDSVEANSLIARCREVVRQCRDRFKQDLAIHSTT